MNLSLQFLQRSFEGLVTNVLVFTPNLIIAFAMIGLGWLVGVSFEKVIVFGSKAAKADDFLERAGLREILSSSGMRLNIGKLFGGIVKWFVFLAFLLAGFEVGGLPQAGVFVSEVIVNYIPKIFTAVIVLFFASIGARAIRKISFSAISSLGMGNAKFPSVVAGYAFSIAALFFVISSIGIDPDFLKIIFIGFVAGLSLAFGLAFGFGGREVAEKVCEKFYKDLTKD
jgi:hypothetical protein